MTRGILRAVAAGLLTISAGAPAFGLDRREQRNVEAPGGRATRIASYGAPDDQCRAGLPPKIEVIERPSYGRLSDKVVRIVAARADVVRPDHPCLGRFIDAIAIYYRPAPGFRGSDRVLLRVTFDSAAASGRGTLEEEIFIAVH
jgi:hypothetical protein